MRLQPLVLLQASEQPPASGQLRLKPLLDASQRPAQLRSPPGSPLGTAHKQQQQVACVPAAAPAPPKQLPDAPAVPGQGAPYPAACTAQQLSCCADQLQRVQCPHAATAACMLRAGAQSCGNASALLAALSAALWDPLAQRRTGRAPLPSSSPYPPGMHPSLRPLQQQLLSRGRSRGRPGSQRCGSRSQRSQPAGRSGTAGQPQQRSSTGRTPPQSLRLGAGHPGRAPPAPQASLPQQLLSLQSQAPGPSGTAHQSISSSLPGRPAASRPRVQRQLAASHPGGMGWHPLQLPSQLNGASRHSALSSTATTDAPCQSPCSRPRGETHQLQAVLQRLRPASGLTWTLSPAAQLSAAPR